MKTKQKIAQTCQIVLRRNKSRILRSNFDTDQQVTT